MRFNALVTLHWPASEAEAAAITRILRPFLDERFEIDDTAQLDAVRKNGQTHIGYRLMGVAE